MVKTKKKRHQTKRKRTSRKKKLIIGFLGAKTNTPSDLWNVDYFGYRKSIPVNQYKTIQVIDNLNLATDYKKNKKIYKFALDEYRRRLLVQIKTNLSSRKLFEKKIKKKYNSKRIVKIIEKIPIKKVQELYYWLLEKEKPNKLSK